MKKTGLFLFVLLLGILLLVPGALFACGLPEGCTPGYWKQVHHLDNWPTADILCGADVADDPRDCLFADVFGVSPTITGLTLGEALRTGGGGEYALYRHAVAALLNAYYGANVDPYFDYCWSPIDVVAAVQGAYDPQTAGTKYDFNLLKGSFAYDNEKNCPLN